MATMYCGFGAKSAMKRKRILDDADEYVSEQTKQHKRSNLTRLPIRTSPTISHNYIRHSPAPDIQRPLTPVDSSDDEAHGQAENAWNSRTAVLPRQRSSTYRVPLATVAGAIDEEMDLSLVAATPSRKRTSSPNGTLSLLHVPTTVLEERAPTPISAKFNLFQDNAKSRSRHVVHHTMLSPMLIEETYLPSPTDSDGMVQSPDAETTMRMENASNGFGALSVACKDDDIMEDVVDGTTNHLGTTKCSRGSRGRNAKLHMGFLADCEKCQQRVPGHYSHIIWS